MTVQSTSLLPIHSGTTQIHTERLPQLDFQSQGQHSEIQYKTAILTAIIIFGTFPSFAKTCERMIIRNYMRI